MSRTPLSLAVQRSNHNQTTLFVVCSGCLEFWRGSNESCYDQTALSAACSGWSDHSNLSKSLQEGEWSDCAECRRSSNNSNHDQTIC